MSKLSRKDWVQLLGIYAVLILILVSLPFLGKAVKKAILSIPGLATTYHHVLQKIHQCLVHWMPQKMGLYVIILIGLGIVYFLFDDILNLIRGKRDKIEERDLPVEDQILRGVAQEYGEKEPEILGKSPAQNLSTEELRGELAKTKINTDIQKRILRSAKNQEMAPIPSRPQNQFDRSFCYSRVIYYSIILVLMIGLAWVWAMAFIYPHQATGLKPVSFTLIGISTYLLFLAKSCTRRIFLDDQHVWMGKNENELFCEKDYASMYYMNVMTRAFLSVRKYYTLVVFRKRFCFPPFAYFIDRFFPASNRNRQVIFMSIWKDEEGNIIPDAALVKRILDHCDQNGVKVKYWPWEAQFFLFIIFFAVGLASWLHWK